MPKNQMNELDSNVSLYLIFNWLHSNEFRCQMIWYLVRQTDYYNLNKKINFSKIKIQFIKNSVI